MNAHEFPIKTNFSKCAPWISCFVAVVTVATVMLCLTSPARAG